MFLLTLYSRSKPYTTRAAAERAAAVWINNHLALEYFGAPENREDSANFKQAFQQENYSECVRIWNEFSKKHFYGDPVRRADIKVIEVDQPF